MVIMGLCLPMEMSNSITERPSYWSIQHSPEIETDIFPWL